jgi:hypothetical protein
MRRIAILFGIATLLLYPLCALADISFGGSARSDAMGGAGIAIVDHSDRNNLLNPASLALMNRRVTLVFPSIGFHASGIPIGKAFDHLFGNPNESDAAGLAKDFGGNPSDFGIDVNLGLRLGHMDIQGTGSAKVYVDPNSALEAWSKNGNGNTTLLLTDPVYKNSQADIIGAAVYSLPSVGMAERISPKGSPTRVELGARMKLMTAYYTHYIMSAASIANNGPAVPAPELNGNTNIHKTGFGMDLGLLVHPSNHEGISGAVVITDAIAPHFTFNGTDATGQPYKYDLQPSSASIGTAYENGRVLLAADLVDITHGYGPTQERVGGEYRTKRIALRMGYASPAGFTFGFGALGLDLAFGARSPVVVSELLHF